LQFRSGYQSGHSGTDDQYVCVSFRRIHWVFYVLAKSQEKQCAPQIIMRQGRDALDSRTTHVGISLKMLYGNMS
jgi:hypothetical protein